MVTNNSFGGSPAASQVGGSIDLLSEILSRVPARPLFRFKCVSQNFLRVISDSSFALLQSERNPKGSCSGVISFSASALPSNSTTANVRKFDFFWINDRLKFTPPPPALAFLQSMSCSRILQSCNGLFLCSSTRSDCAYFVCNPVLGKFRRVDLPDEVGDTGNWKLLGLTLAFDPSRWTGFKVICCMTSAIDVYSSDDGKWKRLASGRIDDSKLAFENGIYWNGKAIWLHQDDPYAPGNPNSNYYVLNLEKEKFEAHALPCSYSMVCYFGETMDRLILVTKDYEAYYMYEMGANLQWVLKYREMQNVMRTRLNPDCSPDCNYVWGGSLVTGVVREERNGEDGLLVIWYLASKGGRVVTYNCKTGLVSRQTKSKLPGRTRQFIESLYWIPEV